MPVAKIAPSMLSCDFAHLAAEAQRMEKNGADWLHLGKFTFYNVRVLKNINNLPIIDVMDG